MKLSKVIYEIYRSDLAYLEKRDWKEPHELDGQVRLEFTDMDPAYVSWVQDKDDFHASYQDKSFFKVELEETKDMSSSQVWEPLIEREIDLAFLDQDACVVAIRSKDKRVYCWAMCVDTITVGRRLPEGVT